MLVLITICRTLKVEDNLTYVMHVKQYNRGRIDTKQQVRNTSDCGSLTRSHIVTHLRRGVVSKH